MLLNVNDHRLYWRVGGSSSHSRIKMNKSWSRSNGLRSSFDWSLTKTLGHDRSVDFQANKYNNTQTITNTTTTRKASTVATIKKSNNNDCYPENYVDNLFSWKILGKFPIHSHHKAYLIYFWVIFFNKLGNLLRRLYLIFPINLAFFISLFQLPCFGLKNELFFNLFRLAFWLNWENVNCIHSSC